MKDTLIRFDQKIINFAQKFNISFARFAIFLVYVWFGLLKVFALSPATPLVHKLFDQTLSGILPFATFNILFGLFEVLIGVLFLFPKLTRIVLVLLVIHLVTTMMPLVILPHEVWTGFLTPTLEGQYIIKNVLIIACAITITAGLLPLKKPEIQ